MLNPKLIIQIILWFLICILMGLASVMVVGMANGSFLALLGFPALIILAMLFVFNRNLLFLLIIISRASIDQFIVSSKMGALGLGAVLNLLVIIMAINAYSTLSIQLKKLIKDSWLIFSAVLFLALIFSPNFANSLKISVNIIAGGAVFIIGLSLIKSESDYAKWLRVILYSSAIPIAYAVYLKMMGVGQIEPGQGLRIEGPFSHPNVLGFYSVLMITVCLLIMKIDIKVFSKLIKNTVPLYALLIFAVLLFTKTRSAWAACFVFVFLYGVVFERKYLVYMLIVMGLALCVPEIQDRIYNLAGGGGTYVAGYGELNSYSWRLQMWHDGLHWMEPKRYLFGYGLNSFVENAPSFFTLASEQSSYHPHNVYVQLFFEVGFFGLAAYVFMNFTLFKYFIKHYKANRLLSFIGIGLLVEYALYAYSDNMLSYLAFNWIYWFVLGISVGYLDFKSKPSQVSLEVELSSGATLSSDIKGRN